MFGFVRFWASCLSAFSREREMVSGACHLAAAAIEHHRVRQISPINRALGVAAAIDIALGCLERPVPHGPRLAHEFACLLALL